MIQICRAGQKTLWIPDTGIREVSGGVVSAGVPVQSTYSVNCDGSNDYVEVSGASLASYSAFTVAFWAKAASWNNAGGSGYPVLLSLGAAGTVRIGIGNTESVFFYAPAAYSTVSKPATGTWFHFALTADHDASEIKLYLDGSLSQTITGQYDYWVLSGMQLGALSGLYLFHGLMDDIRLYGRVLIGAEVLAIYQNTTPTTDGLVGYWPLEEGTGTTTADEAGSSDGTFTNGPTWSTDVPAALA